MALWLLNSSVLIAGVLLAKTALSGAPQAINIFWALAGLIGHIDHFAGLAVQFGFFRTKQLTTEPNLALARSARDAKAAQLAPALLVYCNAIIYYAGA